MSKREELYKLCNSLHGRVSYHAEILQKIVNGLSKHESEIDELKTTVFALYADMQAMSPDSEQTLQ